MSAYMVGHRHIDALLTAAAEWSTASRPLVWFDTDPGEMPPIHDNGELDACGTPREWSDRWDHSDQAAWLAEHRHELRFGDDHELSRIGNVLLAENRRSVDYRYREDGWGIEDCYTYRSTRYVLTLAECFRAISCLRYQSCETREWSTSAAARFLDALEQLAISRTPGYSDGPWEIDDEWIDAKRGAPRLRLFDGGAS
jgi:hypothetical protein